MGDSNTILLVEDTPELLETLRQILEASGYRVFCASSGEVALKFAGERSPEIDLLITDFFLGEELDGHSLSQRLCDDNPNLRVLFMSGGGPQGTTGEFIQKPFSGKTLLDKVRATLI